MPAMTEALLPLRNRLDLYGIAQLARFVQRTHPNTLMMAEIGCYLGESTRYFAAVSAHVYAIDHWQPFPGKPDLSHQVEMLFDQRMRHADNVTKLKMSSREAADQIPDGSLDFVYLDGDHSYEGIAHDIALWLPKLRPNGWIGGHDYNPVHWPHVVRAVHAYLGKPPFLFADTSWLFPFSPAVLTPAVLTPAVRLRMMWQRVLYTLRSAMRSLIASVATPGPREPQSEEATPRSC